MKSVKRNFIINIFRKANSSFLKIYYTKGSAHEITSEAAIGAFFLLFPMFVLSMCFTSLLYKIFHFDLVEAIYGVFISNPVTSPFLLMISYKAGGCFIKTNIQFDYNNYYKNLLQIGYVLIIGSAVVGSLKELIVYYITKYSLGRRRRLKPENSIQNLP